MSVTAEDTAAEFNDAMLDLYDRIKKVTDNSYRPTRFLQAVRRHGGLPYARRMLAKRKSQLGLSRMREFKRPDVSVESLVLEPRFRELFTARELEVARRRLADA